MPSPSPSLVLDLSLRGTALVASLAPAGAAPGPIRTTCERAFEGSRVRNLHDRIVAVLGRANRWGDMDRGSLALLRQLGALLFDEVLPRPVKEALRTAAEGELQLVLDEGLVFVPWELMHTGSAFLGIAFGVGRIVRTPQTVIGLPRPAPEDRWRMLILCDPRGDLMGSYYEGVTLRDELDLKRRRLAVDLRSSEVRVDDVRELIREYDVLHYAGHAKHRPGSPDATGWLLSDGMLTPRHLADLAGGQPFPRLVFSNACRSGTVDTHLVSAERGEMLHSLANAMLLVGVQHYVGTLWDVPDEPACHFSVAMYRALLAGETMGVALRSARRHLLERYGDESVLWASYVLYGAPGARYFEHLKPIYKPTAPEIVPLRERTSWRLWPRPRIPAPSREDTSSPRPEPRAATTRVRGALALSTLTSGADNGAEGWWTTARRWFTRTALTGLIAASFAAISSLAGPQPPPTPGWSPGSSVAHSGPVTYPAPAIQRGRASSAAPAAAVPPDQVLKPNLRVMVQEPGAGLGEPNAKRVPNEGAVLHSWEHFQIHMRLNRPAHAAVWHVESSGAIKRIFPESPDNALGEVATVAWSELPGPDTWYFLDDARGKEMFILAVTDAELLDEDALVAQLRPLQRRLESVRSAGERNDDSTGLKDRVITDDRPLLKRILDVFSAHYEAVERVEFEHR